MSAAHTPSPWTIVPETYSWENIDTELRWIVPTKGSTRVARVVLYSGEAAEQEANALLIAAAPDLLEAAKRARAELDFVADGSTGGIPNAVAALIPEAIAALDAAIAKATTAVEPNLVGTSESE